jgi:hypothetical protein
VAQGVHRTRIYGRYPALLVCCTRIQSVRASSTEDAASGRAFLDEQLAIQQNLLATLRTDPAYTAERARGSRAQSTSRGSG